jgi:hypothetical protein
LASARNSFWTDGIPDDQKNGTIRGRITAIAVAAAILWCAACTRREKAKALFVDLASSSAPCGDDPRWLVVTAVGGHRGRLNGYADAPIAELRQQLREVLKYRAEKVVYLSAEGNTHWGDFIDLVEQVWPETNVVSVLTPEVARQSKRTYCLHPSCRDCGDLGGFRPGNK